MDGPGRGRQVVSRWAKESPSLGKRSSAHVLPKLPRRADSYAADTDGSSSRWMRAMSSKLSALMIPRAAGNRSHSSFQICRSRRSKTERMTGALSAGSDIGSCDVIVNRVVFAG